MRIGLPEIQTYVAKVKEMTVYLARPRANARKIRPYSKLNNAFDRRILS